MIVLYLRFLSWLVIIFSRNTNVSRNAITRLCWWRSFIGFLTKQYPLPSVIKKIGYFTEAGIVAGYAWNSAPIDGTDIIRSIPAIG